MQSRPFSEYDAIVTVFGKRYGKVAFVAKGVRRANAKLCGILQPFCCIRFEYIEPKNGNGLGKLSRAEPLNGGLLHPDPIHLCIAEVAQKISREEQGNAYFYQLLVDVGLSAEPERAVAIFLIKALTLFGFLPHFENCPKCAQRFSSAGRWQPSGEVLCQTDAIAGVALSFDEIKILRFWQHAQFFLCEKVAAEPQTLQKIITFLITFLESEHDFRIKSKSLVLNP